MYKTEEMYAALIYGVFQKSIPLKLFGIFSLQLNLFAWNFVYLVAIHIYLPIFIIMMNFISPRTAGSQQSNTR